MKKGIILMVATALLSLIALTACSADEVSIARETAGSVVVGTWSADEQNITTHLYQNGTGRTENDDGIHEFTWEVISYADALAKRVELMTELS